MKRFLVMAVATVAMLLLAASAEARRHHYKYSYSETGSGIVRSHKTGAIARVGAMFAARFQSYIDALEAHGASVRFMGGIRSGPCSARHEHPCGKALDVCQYRRDVVDPRCHLPDRSTMARIAEAHGLFEGGQWCNGDMGHAQVGVTAPACGERILMARRHLHRHYASR